MKHFGNIKHIDGHDVPLVDVIVGGSPCQDLSIAGKREGFSGERSSLFLDQIRIIREMHDECRRTNQPIRPRFQVWENVPGCTSSADGEDFRTVLEQTARIADPNAAIPRLAVGQCWTNVGVILADRWSIAWRVHDGQFWGKTIIDRRTGNIIKMGTPQRRRRIALVADFSGQCAAEILFEREGLHSDVESCAEAREEESAADARTGLDRSIAIFERFGKEGGGKGLLIQEEKALTLSSSVQQSILQPTTIAIEGNGSRGSHHGDGFAESETMYTLNTVENHAVCYRKTGHPMNKEDAQGWEETEVNDTLNCFDNTEARTPTVICEKPKTWSVGNGQAHEAMTMQEEVSRSLNCMHDPQMVCYGVDRSAFNQGKNAKFDFSIYEDSVVPLVSHGPNGVMIDAVIRKLTPLECERLQGFPDGWTDIGTWVDSSGKKRQSSDSLRYKALGNSICLPFWEWLFYRIGKVVRTYTDAPTMASLFDGIGGFPLVASRNGFLPVWASEIEDFPIAVTKYHFPEEKERKE